MTGFRWSRIKGGYQRNDGVRVLFDTQLVPWRYAIFAKMDSARAACTSNNRPLKFKSDLAARAWADANLETQS